MKIPKPVLRYLLAMNASAFDAAVHAVVGFFGAAGFHQVAGFVPLLGLAQAATLFVSSFVLGIVAWLNKHPLEELLAQVEAKAESGKAESGNGRVQSIEEAVGAAINTPQPDNVIPLRP